jgi:hypothetical protein
LAVEGKPKTLRVVSLICDARRAVTVLESANDDEQKPPLLVPTPGGLSSPGA